MASAMFIQPQPQPPLFSNHHHVNATLVSSSSAIPLQVSSSMCVENTVSSKPKPKITLRFRNNNNNDDDDDSNYKPCSDGDDKQEGLVVRKNYQEDDGKTGTSKNNIVAEAEGLLSADNDHSEENKKRKMIMNKRAANPSFSISLTKQEIEADFLEITSGKRHKRIKKRARNVQENMDDVFPGLSLSSITPQSYKLK